VGAQAHLIWNIELINYIKEFGYIVVTIVNQNGDHQSLKLTLERAIKANSHTITICSTPETETYTCFLPETYSELPLFAVKSLETCYLILLDVVVPYINDYGMDNNTYHTLSISIQEWMRDEDL
jgi:hypothetical protein